MWRFELAAALLSLFCIASSLNAATTQQFTITKDPQAIAIAQKALTAMGGVQALLAYQDSQSSGTLTMYATGSPVNFPITLKSKGTQETRVDLQTPTGTTVRIVNQGRGVIQRPDGSVQRLLLDNTLAERVSYLPLLSILSEYQNTNITIQYGGTALVNGQPADVIAISLVPVNDSYTQSVVAARTQILFYVDGSAGLITKMQYANHEENSVGPDQKEEVYLSSYQTVNGISVPFRQTGFADGKLEFDLVLNSVNFNVGLPDSDFTLPQ